MKIHAWNSQFMHNLFKYLTTRFEAQIIGRWFFKTAQQLFDWLRYNTDYHEKYISHYHQHHWLNTHFSCLQRLHGPSSPPPPRSPPPPIKSMTQMRASEQNFMTGCPSWCKMFEMLTNLSNHRQTNKIRQDACYKYNEFFMTTEDMWPLVNNCCHKPFHRTKLSINIIAVKVRHQSKWCNLIKVSPKFCND